MLKFLRDKLQSLTETQLNLLTAILILINIGIVIFWINFFVSLPKPASPQIEEKPSLVEEIAGSYKPGEIGEISEEEMEKKQISPSPAIIFSTTGIVSEIKPDHLVVQGSVPILLTRNQEN